MATIKIIQDRKHRRADGTYRLKLSVSHKQATRHIALDICLLAEHWDTKRERAVRCFGSAGINTNLDRTLAEVRQLLISLRVAGVLPSLDCNQLRERIKAILNPATGAGQFATAFDAMLAKQSNQRTREIYQATWNIIKAYDPNADALQYVGISRQWLTDFDLWLERERHNRPNTRHIHLRNIRAVLNYALDCGADFAMPFVRFAMPHEETRKRCLSVEQLRHIITAELPEWKCKYRDVFVLQFYLIGINIVDLLTTAQLVGDRVEYRRAKTHRLYSIKVEPEALAIIDRYRGETHLLNVADNYKNYRAFAEKVNNALGTIVDGCTTYFARHTWATIAASLDIPKETIAHALGHGAKSVTDIYIDFDRSKVDEANRKVLNYVLKKKGGTSATL